MSIRASRRSRFLGLAPSAVSAALFLSGVAISLGTASLGLRPRGTSEDAMLSAYERASWQISAEGGGLSSVLYVGHLLGPMLALASLVHARARHRELDEMVEDELALEPLPDAEVTRTAHRISLVLPRAEALRIAEAIRAHAERPHRAVPALSEALERVGALEHVDRVLDAGDESVVAREQRRLERRVGASAGVGVELASYRELEAVPPALAGEHAILSWVLVTQTPVDPLLDVPSHGRAHDWLTELIPIRPEETVLVDAFVTPRTIGASESALARALALEPLRGRAKAA